MNDPQKRAADFFHDGDGAGFAAEFDHALANDDYGLAWDVFHDAVGQLLLALDKQPEHCAGCGMELNTT